jgi:hypothetical protein
MKTVISSVKVSPSVLSFLLKKGFLFAALLSLCQALFAKTILVPAEYPTIQAAVNAALEGDTVLVSPGVYLENVQLRGRNIVLTGRFALDKNAALIEQTIIDGSQPAHPDTASCLLIWKGESAATVVEGFTFRNGGGTVWLDPAGAGIFREGGGILTEFSSPVIRHNIIRNNVVLPPGPGMVSNGGGGIRCGDGAPLIENNRIVHNQGAGYGGGIVLNYCPGAIVRNNVIAFNYGGKDFSGGGFWSTGKDQNTTVTLQNNVIAYNQTPAGTKQFSGKAGGVWTFSIKLLLFNNIIWGNTQALGKQLEQAGAAVDARYNCVQDGLAGSDNITADPVFVDTVCFLLSPGSPCMDAGEPGPGMQDFSGNSRSAAFPARGSLRNDMGAYGGSVRGPLFCNDFWASPQIFTKVSNSPVVNTPGDSRSVNWIDVDGDNDLDLFISNGPQNGENNFLYKNNGKGLFSPVSDDPIVQDNKPSDGATWADFDNDGDNDCFVANWYGINNLLYQNNGNGTFQQVTGGNLVTDGGHSETAAWGDYDNDGRLDLYVTNSGGTKRNFLYHNDGNGAFTKITTGAPVTDALFSRCGNWTDFNNDGNLDLFVTNEEGQNENLYRNTGSGQFIKVTTGALVTDGGKTMSASWGDYDNDGDLDVFLANDQANNALFRNDGAGNFTKITDGPVVNSGGNSFGSQWADVDNDGDLDLFVTNSFWGGPWNNFLFINQGNGTFVRNLLEAPVLEKGWSYGCAFGDMDRDGDLDLAVANCYNATQPDYLYENHAAENANNWLVVHCTGTKSNRSAIGAKVFVRAVIGGATVVQMREISAQSGYCGQNQLPAHFGLGDAASIESVEVRWPSGQVDTYVGLFANQYIALTEDGGVSNVVTPGASIDGLRIHTAHPNPFLDSLLCRFELLQQEQMRVDVLDANGRLIRRLADRIFAPGDHELAWDGKGPGLTAAPAGQYVLVFQTQTGKFVLQVIKSGSGG